MSGKNRNKVRDNVAKKGHYCWGCDQSCVTKSGKCSVCGKRDGTVKRNKRPGPRR